MYTTGRFDTLNKLFDFRRVFHRLASREAHDSSTAVVSWVDLILARLGEAVQRVVDHGTTSKLLSRSPHRMLSEHQGEGALKAALQLPGMHFATI